MITGEDDSIEIQLIREPVFVWFDYIIIMLSIRLLSVNGCMGVNNYTVIIVPPKT